MFAKSKVLILSDVLEARKMDEHKNLSLKSKGWPVWSDPADELLQLKLPKRLALVLIERC